MGGAHYSTFIVRLGSVEGNIAGAEVVGKPVDITRYTLTRSEKPGDVS